MKAPAATWVATAVACATSVCMLGVCVAAVVQDVRNPLRVDRRGDRVTVSCREGWALSVDVATLDARNGTWTCVAEAP